MEIENWSITQDKPDNQVSRSISYFQIFHSNIDKDYSIVGKRFFQCWQVFPRVTTINVSIFGVSVG